jgi:hypothetical protein
MRAPQIITIVLMALSVSGSLSRHGEPKEGCYNAAKDILGIVVIAALLWWGGFWG